MLSIELPPPKTTRKRATADDEPDAGTLANCPRAGPQQNTTDNLSALNPGRFCLKLQIPATRGIQCALVFWDISDIVDAVEVGLSERARADDAEQTIRGFDASDEISLHPLIQNALKSAGFGVFPEQRFPSDRRKRRKSEGRRCDIVLTPNNRPLTQPDVENTLFEPKNAVNLSDAYWLEIKTTAQFTPESEPNPRYTAELMQPVRRDVSKLAKDDAILHAGVLLLLLCADSGIALHDLAIWRDQCLAKGYSIGAPAIRSVPIADRIGHTCATIALFPVHHL